MRKQYILLGLLENNGLDRYWIVMCAVYVLQDTSVTVTRITTITIIMIMSPLSLVEKNTPECTAILQPMFRRKADKMVYVVTQYETQTLKIILSFNGQFKHR